MNKVLIIANIRKTQGGITTQVKELTDSLVSEDIDVEVISMHGSIVERMKGVFYSFFKAKKCDVILGVGCAYTGFFPIVIAFILSVLRNKYVVYNFHDGQVKEFLQKYYGLVNVVLKNNKVIVATKYLYEEFKHYGFNVEIIHNHFNELIIEKSNEYRNDKIKIMWARSFEKLYRADLALKTASFYSNNKNVEFHFYGGGSEYNYFKDKYKGDNIFFHGIIKRDILLKEYQKYQIFLNTSDYDNFPMSIVEAGLNNMIVVSSKVGGIITLYSDIEIVYFESGNIDSLILNLQKVLNNLSEYLVYSKSLFSKVLTFNWINVRKQWLNTLNIGNQ